MPEPELGISTALFRPFLPDKHLALLAEHGVKLTELSTNCFDIFQDKARTGDLRRALTRTGVRVHSVHVPFPIEFDISNPDRAVRQKGIDAALLCLDRLVTLGGRYLVVHPCSGPVSDDEAAARARFASESLHVLSEHVGAAPFPKVAVENLIPMRLAKDSAQLIELLDAVGSPHLGVCLDVNHVNLSEDLVEATLRYGRRILTLHISDNDGVAERHWIPGRGVLPWKAWVKALLSTGYAGPFMCELGKPKEDDPPESDRIAEICRSGENLLLAPAREFTAGRD